MSATSGVTSANGSGHIYTVVVKAAADLFGVVEVGKVEPGGSLGRHQRLAPPKAEDAWLDHDVDHVEGEGQLILLIIREKYYTHSTAGPYTCMHSMFYKTSNE